MSLPDISLLEPLAGTLGVTVAELLHGERLDAPLPPRQVDALVSGAVAAGPGALPGRCRPAAAMAWHLGRRGGAGGRRDRAGRLVDRPESAGPAVGNRRRHRAACAGLAGFAGLLFCLLEDQLPAYYDEYAVPGYMRGAFHMRLPGVRFTNRNWLPVRRAGFGVSVGVWPGTCRLCWFCRRPSPPCR